MTQPNFINLDQFEPNVDMTCPSCKKDNLYLWSERGDDYFRCFCGYDEPAFLLLHTMASHKQMIEDIDKFIAKRQTEEDCTCAQAPTHSSLDHLCLLCCDD